MNADYARREPTSLTRVRFIVGVERGFNIRLSKAFRVLKQSRSRNGPEGDRNVIVGVALSTGVDVLGGARGENTDTERLDPSDAADEQSGLLLKRRETV